MRILGRSGSSTLVLGGKTVWTVTDTGVVSATDLPSSWLAVALKEDSLYALTPMGLVAQRLEPNSAPVTLFAHEFSAEALRHAR
ncbi:MAG: hypothetical protein QM744_09470 [Mesorhizobium sp.]